MIELRQKLAEFADKELKKKLNKNIINCLYSHFKNAPKKLKIVCDWDEIIQAHEPYALYLATKEKQKVFSDGFKEGFKLFWNEESIEYSPYGSKLKERIFDKEKTDRQQIIKNSHNFYQEAPFLTIAKELLMLIKENKIEQIIFLSAYDKRKFPNSDPRKPEIFKETFGKFPNCSLQLIGFDSERQGGSKSDWINKHASDFDLVIDDNPNILVGVLEDNPKMIALAPYYPAVADQHHENVLLIKTSVSDLKKENFRLPKSAKEEKESE